MSEAKQVIVINKDLKMDAGKAAAQVAHASIAFLAHRLRSGKKISLDSMPDAEQAWIRGAFTKVCLRVDSHEELLEILAKAECAGLETHLITDAGRTVFDKPTDTCIGIGPDFADKIDPITGHLRLYR